MLRASHRGRFVLPAALSLALLSLAFAATLSLANVPLTQVSSDPFTNATSQHRTQVEPDTFQFGSTIVSAFQSGRFVNGGAASGIGFATSNDGGGTWTNGFLPGISRFFGNGPFDRATDPAVAFSRRQNAWLISTLGLNEAGGTAVLTSRSTDGGRTWSNPVTTATGSFLDKNWIACDNTPTSPFFGNCYTEFDDVNDSGRLKMSASTDGGASWGPARNTGDNATGLGGQPVVRPNGTVLVPYRSNSGQIRSFRSINGGQAWRSTVLVSGIQSRTVPGGLRTSPLPSAEIDAAGQVYVVWQDCRFRSGCTANDIVMSKSVTETTWGAVTRVTSDAGDHFIPGIGVDRSTSGGSARISLTYYAYPNANCSASTCQLTVRYTSSTNGGASWTVPTQLAGPFSLSSVANTDQGRMVGDYISTSVIEGGRAHSVFAVANAPSGGVFDEAMNAPTGGLPVGGGTQPATTGPVLAPSGHAPTPETPAVRN